MRILILAAALAAGPAVAGDRIVTQGADEVRLSDGPCVHAGTLALIPEKLRSEFHKADGTFGGQRFFGCWRDMNGEAAGVQWEDGDQGLIPYSVLRPVKET